MEKIKKGDIVARKSHNADILFTVEKLIKSSNQLEIAILKGITIRIVADAFLDDLIIYDKTKINESLRNLDRHISNLIIKKEKNHSNINYSSINAGKILHFDGDSLYSEKSLKYYKKVGLNAIVKNIPENKQPLYVKNYIEKYNPDILVLTGHDGMFKNGTKFGDIYNYRNSKYFVQGVIEARKLIPSSRKLAIFAGACQSFFEAIIAAGANFASSPGRILIDFMDPLIVAEKIAITDENQFITIDDIYKELKGGKKSIDGIGTLGKRK